MSATRNVAVLVGSLRKDSFHRKVANAVIGLAPDTLKLEIVEIGQLPLSSQDDDANPPGAVSFLPKFVTTSAAWIEANVGR